MKLTTKQRIDHITLSSAKDHAVAFIHRGAPNCKMYSQITLSSLRRAQRAQIKLLESATA